MAVPLPDKFVGLSTAWDRGQIPSNLIGVCVDYLPVCKSRGSDFTSKFTLHDPTWSTGLGMTCRFFHADQKNLPAIANCGDVLIIRNVKVKEIQGQKVGLSNSATTWVVLSGSSIENSTSPIGADIAFTKSATAGCPSIPELDYAKAILKSEDRSTFPPPPKATSLQIASITSASGGNPDPVRERFSLIESLIPPGHGSQLVFVDILCEVRKVFSNDFRVELSVSDYTAHRLLYNYACGCDEEGTEGDKYGYLNQKPWPGPWGQMTLVVALWDIHAAFAKENVTEGQFVFLRNVQIKYDRNGSRLEGACRGDRLYPDRVNVSIQKPRDAGGDERMLALLKRKREYERTAKTQNLKFVRGAVITKRRAISSLDEEQLSKSKKAKMRNKRKTMEKQVVDGAGARNQDLKEGGGNPLEQDQKLESNTHVRCINVEVPLKPIDDILDPNILKRRSPKGKEFCLPFQNCRYRSKVRVVDYFPHDLANFAAPYRDSIYEELSDHEGDEDSDIEMTQAGGNDIRWQWRFFLLVEDVRAQYLKGGEPARMELLIADTDGDYLLNMEACDLRKNPNQLAHLREKLFVLWGDLQETKESAVDGEADTRIKHRARPFECFIKEYGITEKPREGGSASEREVVRMFRLFGTSIK